MDTNADLDLWICGSQCTLDTEAFPRLWVSGDILRVRLDTRRRSQPSPVQARLVVKQLLPWSAPGEALSAWDAIARY